MLFLRKLLFPFSILYWIVTFIRNILYDNGLFKAVSYDVPVIAVGNLNVGGTGKTPQVEYLIRLLSPHYKVAVLSRGYKRKSSGFVLADESSTAATLGDEPYQYHSKFKNIDVAVDADRRNGISKLLDLCKPEVILLDDAFQHRKVRAGLYILLTAYNDLYADDFVLPMGNLREPASGTNRANIIVVTKCPRVLSNEEQVTIIHKLKLKPDQQIYFSFIEYDDLLHGQSSTIAVSSAISTGKTLVAGIANPKHFFEYLQKDGDQLLKFPDHHEFSEADIDKIVKASGDGMIVTTEKDYVRLRGKIAAGKLYYLPIKSNISDSENFDKTILDYVGKSTANS